MCEYAKENKGADTGSNVVALNTNCCVEKCGKKVSKMNFCAEHYAWFKEGLVNKKGQLPPDFDKKYQAYMTKKKAA
ncbi:MAG: hypothetical protein HC902_10590 [Calothrix sp. SM1_5_4]|nr:hypothetical protein [Calothrix sp. SM1_5_4]